MDVTIQVPGNPPVKTTTEAIKKAADAAQQRGGVTMVPDHAHPKSRGGDDGVDNRLPACGGCNAAKGWLTVEEYRTVKGLRRGDLSFRFAGEDPALQRDWLCVHSEERERELFLHNQPWARDAYSRGRSLRKRHKEAARRSSDAS